ncbi:MAG: ATP synthase F1 subunit epsilon [Pseudomonadota bacterium]
MMAKFSFELVSPESLLISSEVDAVTLPGSEGEFQVLAEHAPFLALLGPGIVTVTGAEGGDKRIFIDGGFCDVSATTCSVLAEAAVAAEDAADRVDAIVADAEKTAATLQGHALDDAHRRLATLKTIRAAL